MSIRLLVGAAICFAFAEVGFGQIRYELIRKIENPKGTVTGSGDEFGISLAQVGDSIAIGAYRDDTGAINSGAAYVFDRHGALLSTIHNPTPEMDDWFGYEVTSLLDTIVIAARNDSTAGFDSGSVYLYDQQGSLIRTIINPTPASNDDFGNFVLGLGDKLLVTAWRDDSLAENAGAAYLFDQEGNLLQEFFSPNPIANGRFGRFPTSLGEDKFLTSAFAESVDGVRRDGATYLFDLDGNVLQSFPNPRPGEGNLFGGRVVALGDDRVVITAYEDSSSGVSAGTAYMYDLEGNLQQTIHNPSPAVQDWFGRTMTGVGMDRFLIGAEFDDTLGDNAGAVYLYGASGELIQMFLPPEPAPGGHFGSTLGTLDELILIGSHFAGGRFTGPGAVYVYAPVAPLAGDFNGDSTVDQVDLDMVLGHWGADANLPPDGWIGGLPSGLINQTELDQVLANWGDSGARSVATATPEPSSSVLAGLATFLAAICWLRTRRLVDETMRSPS